MLLLVKLRELVRKKQAFEAGVGLGDLVGEKITITLKEFQDAARAHGIKELDEFLKCELFKRAGFMWDAEDQTIVRLG